MLCMPGVYAGIADLRRRALEMTIAVSAIFMQKHTCCDADCPVYHVYTLKERAVSKQSREPSACTEYLSGIAQAQHS